MIKMANSTIIEKKYVIKIELDEHEISMFQATLGMLNIPETVHKSFTEYSEEELELLYKQIREGISR